MSSITSGGITSTTLDCSLAMSTVDSASEKYKQKNKFVSKTTSCGIQLCLELPFVVFAKSSKKFPALYTVSMFPPAFFSALNTIYMCVRVALLLHFLSALCTTDIKDIPSFTQFIYFPRFRKAETLIAVLSVSLKKLSRKEFN